MDSKSNSESESESNNENNENQFENEFENENETDSENDNENQFENENENQFENQSENENENENETDFENENENEFENENETDSESNNENENENENEFENENEIDNENKLKNIKQMNKNQLYEMPLEEYNKFLVDEFLAHQKLIYQTQKDYDFFIYAGKEQKKILCHQLTLNSRSPFMYIRNHSQKNPHFFLPDFEPEIVEKVIHFIYTAEIEINNNNFEKIYQLAHLFILTTLKIKIEKEIENFIKKQTKDFNPLEYYFKSCDIGSRYLMSVCQKLIGDIGNFIEKDKFGTLDDKNFVKIIKLIYSSDAKNKTKLFLDLAEKFNKSYEKTRKEEKEKQEKEEQEEKEEEKEKEKKEKKERKHESIENFFIFVNDLKENKGIQPDLIYSFEFNSFLPFEVLITILNNKLVDINEINQKKAKQIKELNDRLNEIKKSIQDDKEKKTFQKSLEDYLNDKTKDTFPFDQVLEKISFYKQDERIQETGISVLNQLSDKININKFRDKNLRGIPIILEAMKGFEDNENIQEKSILYLNKINFDLNDIQEFKNINGNLSIETALNKFTNNENIQNLGKKLLSKFNN
ncbi:pep-cterm sorting domain-containing protein [Anaeramoeba ignava]|uniref:Pep-cterm sorting domain-containing protein n=1 Tax=Anaeramoeba ignava TaxID=1746090 RepID=A0A9Q0LD84_ANAIG|nr:pep-cterm sorting domain-containing protein [Anaeramoeba ignava]